MDKIKKTSIGHLRPETVNALRDAAIKIEKDDINIAYELMSLAQIARPNGKLISKKLDKYASSIKLQEKVESGEIAIIPIGFRCYTKEFMSEELGIEQESLVFDFGFFPPSSIVSILKKPKINLSYENEASQTVCIKHEYQKSQGLGRCIKFQQSSYDEIDSIVTSRDMDGINKYLDRTFGYYTLDKQHKYVLAHYNWHKFSNIKKSQGVTDPKINLENINNTLNRRIERMFEKCNKAKYIFFIYGSGKTKNYNHMMIDEEKFNLNDFKEIEKVTKDMYDAKIFVVNIAKLNSPEKLFRIIEEDS